MEDVGYLVLMLFIAFVIISIAHIISYLVARYIWNYGYCRKTGKRWELLDKKEGYYLYQSNDRVFRTCYRMSINPSKAKFTKSLRRDSHWVAKLLYTLHFRCGGTADIAGEASYGYGKLNSNGYWQFPLYFK